MATPTSPAFFLLHVFLFLVCSSEKGHAVSANEITKTYFRDVHADSLLPSSVCDQSNKVFNRASSLKVASRNGPCSVTGDPKTFPSAADIVLQDDIRVKSLRTRLSMNTSTTGTLDEKKTTIPSTRYGGGYTVTGVAFHRIMRNSILPNQPHTETSRVSRNRASQLLKKAARVALQSCVPVALLGATGGKSDPFLHTIKDYSGDLSVEYAFGGSRVNTVPESMVLAILKAEASINSLRPPTLIPSEDGDVLVIGENFTSFDTLPPKVRWPVDSGFDVCDEKEIGERFSPIIPDSPFELPDT
ncbi:hypothetical protein SADUNF_Sadunf18G0010100 [Salix dunnii]|uniref:Uncharacterized protein n=1 Tax=Salix dunnii TaxID=1413687 RepID=A0A835J5B5_9ROSI|nr:hypothetical protein SADUNF_Sadunf18G0010100 [Salix dunnii]